MVKTRDCLINGKRYQLSEIERWGWQKFSEFVHVKIPPRRLVRYFPNTIENKKNYSIEALQNGTVYLNDAEKFDDSFDCAVDLEWVSFYEMRIKQYCQYLKIDISNVSIQNMPYRIILKLFEYGTVENAINNIDSTLDIAQRFTVENFINKVFLNCKDVDSCVPTVYNIIVEEYNKFQSMLQHFKITCFSTSPYLNRMWANSYNKGFCVEYEIDYNSDLFVNLFPVIYSQKRNDFSLLSQDCDKTPSENDLWQIYFNGLLRKSLDWKDQCEWRLIKYEPDNRAKNIPFFKIKKVYLGNKMSYAERQTVINICKEKSIPYVGLVRKTNSFDLIECIDDCFTCQRGKK